MSDQPQTDATKDKTMTDVIELGDIARDELTGFEGVVTGRTHWLTNCDRLTLTPRKLDKDGQPQKEHGFDITHCKLVEKAALAAPEISIDQRKHIQLGDTARDEITGFEGIVIARASWLGNGDRLVLQPKSLKEDGQPKDTYGANAANCVMVQALKPPAPKENRGGPMPEVRRSTDPTR